MATTEEILWATAEFYGSNLSEVVLGIWTENLADYDPERVKKAFSAHMRDPRHYKQR